MSKERNGGKIAGIAAIVILLLIICLFIYLSAQKPTAPATPAPGLSGSSNTPGAGTDTTATAGGGLSVLEGEVSNLLSGSAAAAVPVPGYSTAQLATMGITPNPDPKGAAWELTQNGAVTMYASDPNVLVAEVQNQ